MLKRQKMITLMAQYIKGNVSHPVIMDDALPHDFYDTFEDEDCLHENVYTNDRGDGYCMDCGRNIVAGDDIHQPCKHTKTYKSEAGTHVCRDCNKEIEVLSQEAEWRYYDNSCSRDPARCHQKTSSRNLDKAFSKIDIPDAIKNAVEKDFYAIVGDDTLRGKNRSSLIAVCTFYAYYFAGQYRPISYFQSMFDVTQRDMSSKIKMYQEYNPQAAKIKIGPKHLVNWICNMVGIDEIKYDNKTLNKIVSDIHKICDFIHNTSKEINRSTPRSVASAIVYFYLCIKPEYKLSLKMTKTQFSKLVGSSEITIDKLAKEISRITKLPMNSM